MPNVFLTDNPQWYREEEELYGPKIQALKSALLDIAATGCALFSEPVQVTIALSGVVRHSVTVEPAGGRFVGDSIEEDTVAEGCPILSMDEDERCDACDCWKSVGKR